MVIRIKVLSHHEWDYESQEKACLSPLLLSRLSGMQYSKSQQSAMWKRALNRICPHWHPDNSLPASRAVRKAFLSFVSYLASAILLWQPAWTMVATDPRMGEEESHIYLKERAPCKDITAQSPLGGKRTGLVKKRNQGGLLAS